MCFYTGGRLFGKSKLGCFAITTIHWQSEKLHTLLVIQEK